MNRIELPALIGSHPLGALASFGLLRVVSTWDPNARLSFVERDDWIASLHSELASTDALLDHLADWITGRGASMLDWAGEHDIRVQPEIFRNTLERAVASRDTEYAEFLAAFIADGVVDKSKGLAKPSPFYMASGQQSFAQALRSILDAVKQEPHALFREALLGPWSYETQLWGAGWDPGTERNYALRFKAPASDKTSCIAAAVWLGFEALPLFPAFMAGHRDGCVAFAREGVRLFRWPVVARPVGLATLRVLVAADPVQLAARDGIAAIYQSERFEFGQGYGVFRPATIWEPQPSRADVTVRRR